MNRSKIHVGQSVVYRPHRCGKGWTRRAAARDLGLQLWRDNR